MNINKMGNCKSNNNKNNKYNNTPNNNTTNNKIKMIKIECKICNLEYTNNNYPIVLECGHTICQRCFNLIINKNKKCPFDNSIITNLIAKKNFELIEILENNSQYKNEESIKIESEYPQLNELNENNDNNFTKCPNNHQLTFTGNIQTCVRCGDKSLAISCNIDKYHLCIQNCLNEKLKFNTKLCILNHPLQFITKNFECISCLQNFTNGFSCPFCNNYIQCVYCSDFTFNTQNCPNNHKLIWIAKPQTCSRCLLKWTGFGCEMCNYFLCNKKCIDDLNLNKIYLNRITFIKTFEIHKEAVSCVIKLSQNLIATGSADKMIKIFKFPQCIHIKTFNDHLKNVEFMIRINEQLFASCGDDNLIIIFNYKTLSKEFILSDHSGWVLSLEKIKLDNGNIILVSSSTDKTIKFWDLNTKKCLNTFISHLDFVMCLCYVSSLKLLASGGGDKIIKIWSILDVDNFNKNNSNKPIKNLKGHSDWISSLCNLDENLFASGSKDFSVRIWDLKSFVCVKILKGHTGSILSIIKLNKNELVIASSNKEKTIKIWNYKEGNIAKEFSGHSDKIYSLIKMNENEIISGSRDKTIKFWKF